MQFASWLLYRNGTAIRGTVNRGNRYQQKKIMTPSRYRHKFSILPESRLLTADCLRVHSLRLPLKAWRCMALVGSVPAWRNISPCGP